MSASRIPSVRAVASTGRALALCACAVALLTFLGAAARAEESTPRQAILEMVASMRLDKPVTRGPLTIIPLVGSRDLPHQLATLSEALGKGEVKVEEIGEGRVNELSVENLSDRYVYIMAGQILVGAKQNRVLQDDLLLPPHSGRISVSAFCVQQGRWHYGKDKVFAKSDNVSNPSVRQAARASKEQTAVWGAVKVTQDKAGAGNSSSDLDETYNSPQVKKEARGYEAAFRDLPTSIPEMRGAVVLLNGRILAVDAFGSRKIFRALWPSLLSSYTLEAINESTKAMDWLQAARSFLAMVARDEVIRKATPGSGVLVELKGDAQSGASLLTESGVLHLELFSLGEGSAKLPPPEGPIQRQYPNQSPR